MDREREADEFGAFFERATGHAPYPYQVELALRERLPARLEIPTGLGKTEAAIVAWLWRRRHAPATVRDATPRRLVYCLPMRVLVTQTADVARTIVRKAELADIGVTVLMGGATEAPEDSPWDIHPERDAIVVGTQDMLLSRALNRGYAMSRYRWPIPFGLLNNDCLWVIDEPQLLGAGLPSTAQLQAFRSRRFGAFGPTATLWMSATLDEGWLRTVDVHAEDVKDVVALGPSDIRHERVTALTSAPKALARAPKVVGDAKGLAKLVRDEHRPATRTLVIVNTIARARELHEELRRGLAPKGRAKKGAVAETGPRLVLLHSQFRDADRREREREALADPDAAGTIVVSTQVVEAGVDLTSSTLFTEFAPWASLVQRFGRCNRRAEDPSARVFWIDLKKPTPKDALPYDLAALDAARGALEKLGASASAASIAAAAVPLGAAPLTHVVRARDLLELFDTTPDLSGADVDVSRFVRETSDRDVQVFWRNLDGDRPDDQADPCVGELCPAPIGELKEWLKSHPAWRWNLVEEQWERVRPEHVHPGLELLLRARDGGYEPEKGWNPEAPGPVPVVAAPSRASDRREGDEPLSTARRAFVTLADHSSDVAGRAARIAEAVGLEPSLRDTFVRAARYHDAGKAHEVFQKTMAGPEGGPWAKSEKQNNHERRGFRHELVSALLALENGEPDLLAYLVASHHGKVRMRIRSNPNEKRPPERERLFAKGVWDGESVGPVDLGAGVSIPATLTRLEYMLMGDSSDGTRSWTARVLALRDAPELGPLRLAYLEALLRAADERASAGMP